MTAPSLPNTPPRLKVLLGCYACGPNHGSEPGVGWGFATLIAKYHDVHILLEKDEFEEKVTKYSQEHPEEVQNMHFHYIRRTHHNTLRKIWPPSYYWSYRAWQKKAYQYALELDKKENFDLTHHITIIGYREPGYLWKLGKPFIWGPVGGHVNSPWCLIPSLGLRGIIHFGLRNIINEFQKRWASTPRAAAKAATIILSSSSTTQEEIRAYWGRETTYMSLIGCDEKNIKTAIHPHTAGTPLKICWVGETVTRKAAPLLFEAISQCTQAMELHLFGRGDQLEPWRAMVKQMGLADSIHIHGYVPQVEVWEHMEQSHVLCISSILEDTPLVTLEALCCGLPVIALDFTGFRDVITDNCGIKIPLENKKQVVQDFTKALDELAINEDKRQRLALGALERSKDYLWSEKIKAINELYAQVCPTPVARQ